MSYIYICMYVYIYKHICFHRFVYIHIWYNICVCMSWCLEFARLFEKLRDVNDATFNILSRGVAVLIPYQSKLKIRNPSWVVCWLQQSDVSVQNNRHHCWLLMGIPTAMPGISPSPLFLYQCRWIYHWSTISIYASRSRFTVGRSLPVVGLPPGQLSLYKACCVQLEKKPWLRIGPVRTDFPSDRDYVCHENILWVDVYIHTYIQIRIV